MNRRLPGNLACVVVVIASFAAITSLTAADRSRTASPSPSPAASAPAAGIFNLTVTLLVLPEAGEENDGTVVDPKVEIAALKKNDQAVVLLEKTIPAWEMRTEKLKGRVEGKVAGQSVKVDYDLQITPRFLTGGDAEFNVNAQISRSIDNETVRTRTVRALGEAPHLRAMAIRAAGVVLVLTPLWK